MSDTLTQGLRDRLGVAEDANEDTILAALDEALAEQTEAPAAKVIEKVVEAKLPEGHTTISKDVLDELRINAAAGAEARKVQLAKDRDEVLDGHVVAGNITPARRAFWAAKWDLDPEGTRSDLATIGEPVLNVKPAGHGGSATATDDDANYTKLFGDESKGV